MLLALLMVAAQNALNVPQPGVSLATVADFDFGFCNVDGSVGQPAIVRVAWTIVNADDTNFETHVYQDGYLSVVLPSSTTHWDFTLNGLVNAGGYNRFTADSVFRIDIVRKADSVAVASQETNRWQTTYGTCSE